MNTLQLAGDVDTFAAARSARLDEQDTELRPVVEAALAARRDGDPDWAAELAVAAGVLWSEIYETEGGQAGARNVDEFVGRLTAHLDATSDVPASQREAQIERITYWVAVFTLNDATVAAVEGTPSVFLRWVTMRDEDVRATHRALEGQTIVPGGTFNVNGNPLHYPGEPVGPPEIWINCRCMAMPIPGGEMGTAITAATTPGAIAEVDDVDDIIQVEDVEDEELPPEWDEDVDIEVPWHGVLAVEGIPTGDLRRFASQAITFDQFPLPLTWQRLSADRHDGSVVIGRITNAWTGTDGLVYGEGMFRISPEADEVIDMIANGDLRGVSVELDSIAMEYSDVDGQPINLEEMTAETEVYQHLTAGRVRSATVLPVAAFAESYVALGPWDQSDLPDDAPLVASCAPCIAAELDAYSADLAAFAISEQSWDGSASRFSDDEWIRSTIVDRGPSFDTPKTRFAVPIREPNGDLSRAGVHAAAARLDQVDAPAEAIASARRRLVAAYKQLGEEAPESLTAAAFAPGTHDGPGWITHPQDTQRLRTYWTRGKGAAKIRWGQPGDFNRCRRQLAKYVPNPSYLAGTCANLHYVALGVWPGRETASVEVTEAGVLAASGEAPEPEVAAAPPAPNPVIDQAALPKAEWFKDPGLPLPTPITIFQDEATGRYRVVGHAAAWGVCHIGLGLSVGADGCTTAPHSNTGYAHYRVGAVETDEGLVPTGRITMGTGHAPHDLSAYPAAEHYDNTGTVVADVAAGEDEHGIWLAGVLRPGVTAQQRAELLAAGISGDWRWIGGNLEMVATLAVNTPGFPIPRVAVAASGGRQTALMAAGIVPPRIDVSDEPHAPVLLSAADVARELRRLQRNEETVRAAQERLAAVRKSFNTDRAARALAAINPKE